LNLNDQVVVVFGEGGDTPLILGKLSSTTITAVYKGVRMNNVPVLEGLSFSPGDVPLILLVDGDINHPVAVANVNMSQTVNIRTTRGTWVAAYPAKNWSGSGPAIVLFTEGDLSRGVIVATK
jgi:hypothetical protein